MSEQGFVPFALPDVGEEEIAAVVETIRSGWLTTGPQSKAFEEEFSGSLGGGIAVAVNSATAGLHLALEACGISPGDEVIVPAWTFTATAEVVRYLGAEPVIVDVDQRTLNLDLEAASAAVTARTRAVIPVHFAGLPCGRSALADFAEQHDLDCVEDAAHAFPVLSEKQPVGRGESRAVVFSFYATKTMTTGEGGMVITDEVALANRMRTMRLHGINRDVFDRYRSVSAAWRYDVVAPGFKYNMTDIAASLGRVQLRRSGQMRDARERIAYRYDQAFADLAVDLPARPAPDSGNTHAWHLYVLRLRSDAPVTRDELIDELARRGVGASVHFIPLHHHPYWHERRKPSAPPLRVADAEFERVCSLPIYSSMSERQVEKVVTAVRGILT